MKPDGTQETVQSKLYFAACERESDVGNICRPSLCSSGFENSRVSLRRVVRAGRPQSLPDTRLRGVYGGRDQPVRRRLVMDQETVDQHKPVEGMDPNLFEPERLESCPLDSRLGREFSKYRAADLSSLPS